MNKGREKVLEFIRTWLIERSYSPTIREIAQGIGFRSTKAVKVHLDRLAREGLIRRSAYRARSIELPDRAGSLPILGRVAAGSPLLAVENVEGRVSLDEYRGCFLLRVKGDSMIDAGILPNDLVIVQPQPTAENGSIVVALIEDEATVKYFYRGNGRIRLQPANTRMKPLLIEAGERNVQVLGRVVGVLRRL